MGRAKHVSQEQTEQAKKRKAEEKDQTERKEAEKKKAKEEARKAEEEEKKRLAEEEERLRKEKEEAEAKAAAKAEAAAAAAAAEGKKKKTAEEPLDEDDDEDDSDPYAKHDEFVIGEIASVRAVKKQKGFVLCEIDAGGDDNISVVSGLRGLQAGFKIILAMEGSTVQGKEVESSMVRGEWNAGVICSAK